MLCVLLTCTQVQEKDGDIYVGVQCRVEKSRPSCCVSSVDIECHDSFSLQPRPRQQQLDGRERAVLKKVKDIYLF